MSGPLAFDDASVRQSARKIGSSLGAVPAAGYPSCDDCGSALLAATVQLFLDQFAPAVKAEKKKAERTSASMTACADDFNMVETANVQSSRNFMQMLSQ